MKYSLDRIQKPGAERRGGYTTSKICSAIGCLMATDNHVVPYVVPYSRDWPHIRKEFFQIAEIHFNETPETNRQFELSIKGFSSKVLVVSQDMYDRGRCRGMLTTDPIFDLY